MRNCEKCGKTLYSDGPCGDCYPDLVEPSSQEKVSDVGGFVLGLLSGIFYIVIMIYSMVNVLAFGGIGVTIVAIALNQKKNGFAFGFSVVFVPALIFAVSIFSN